VVRLTRDWIIVGLGMWAATVAGLVLLAARGV
jgi:hypothetical protein